MSILDVKNVSIRYTTGDFKEISLKEYLLLKLQGKYQVTEFWADKNITFCLEKGDMLGIIGTNGSGKSTLLKCISGIMEPTKGTVTRTGNIAALLELGSGFDGDLTVKENTYLRGALLGYTRSFMDETYNSIIDFAELREFENRPFKKLSSGMRSRLAFSIASMVQPDILILDEVLSVGDGAFRKKSEIKMKEVIANGTTTILVSHSLGLIRSMCSKVLWLHKGEQVEFGSDVQGICDRYKEFLIQSSTGTCEAPKLTVTLRKNGKPELCWDKIIGAVKYEVFISDSKDGVYKKLVDTVYRRVLHNAASPNTTYFYKARAIYSPDGSSGSNFSEIVSIEVKSIK
ncbi:MAG: ABC transporter ATP-binding protein [Oscillospiraceae bacterium]|nr:ABC transporter ATP-binding protein [Oscillospiraceae bacterium]